jgi:rhodanese-related sulfurtransferase
VGIPSSTLRVVLDSSARPPFSNRDEAAPAMPLNLPAVPMIAPAELKRLLDSGTPLAVLDVREPHEREAARIPIPDPAADLFIPMGEVPARVDTLAAQVDGRTLVVYCHHGIRSLVVGRWLATQPGFPAVKNLDGGIDAYSAEADSEVPRYG